MKATRAVLLTIATLVALSTKGAHTRSIEQPDFNREAFGDVLPWLTEPEESENLQLVERRVHSSYNTQFSKSVSSRYFDEKSEQSEIFPWDPTIDDTDLPKSCDELAAKGLPTGSYSIASYSGEPVNVFCDMSPRCSAESEKPSGWRRVGFLNMTDPTQQCPSRYSLVDVGGKRLCGRSLGGQHCYSIQFDVDGLSYTQVSGRVKAYMKGIANGFGSSVYYKQNEKESIYQSYLDGVTLTYGDEPRNHIWSFAASSGGRDSCPCHPDFNGYVPSFTEADYFCDTGSSQYIKGQWYLNAPLWDGKSCTDGRYCCQDLNGIDSDKGIFCTQLENATAENIDFRMCVDSYEFTDEDIGIEEIEIFVK